MIPPRVLLAYAVPLALVAGGIATYAHQQREIGRQDVLLHAADSAAKVDKPVSIKAQQVAITATQIADSMKLAFVAERRKDAVVARKVDSTIAVLRMERGNALDLVSDTAATIDLLKGQMVRLVAASDSAEASHTAQRLILVQGLADAGKVITADSVALALGGKATRLMEKRAVGAEAQVALLRRALPSTVGGWVKLGLAAGVGYAVGRLPR